MADGPKEYFHLSSFFTNNIFPPKDFYLHSPLQNSGACLFPGLKVPKRFLFAIGRQRTIPSRSPGFQGGNMLARRRNCPRTATCGQAEELPQGGKGCSSATCVLAMTERYSPVRSAKRSCSRLGKVGSGSDRRRIGGNGPESVANGRFPGPRPERNCPRPARISQAPGR